MTALTFLIPVRHHASVADWPAAMLRLQATARSIANQSCDAWRAIVVANRDAPIPSLPAGFSVVRVDLALPDLPAPDAGERFYEAVRADKGRRVLQGLVDIPAASHVMIVDYDDFVSRRLAEHVVAHPGAPGWKLDSGYLYDESSLLYRVNTGFATMCGTSHIVRRDLFGTPPATGADHEAWLRRQLGSHRFIDADLAAAGTPLARLPFAGAIYRIGYAGTTSHSDRIVGRYFQRWMIRRRPLATARHALHLRPLTPGLRTSFFG